jgi:hypothetical protein
MVGDRYYLWPWEMASWKCGLFADSNTCWGLEAEFISDVLRGDETTETRVKLVKRLEKGVLVGDD